MVKRWFALNSELKNINWKYIWKSHCLQTENKIKLLDNFSSLESFGINKNNNNLYFVKYHSRREKGKRKMKIENKKREKKTTKTKIKK